MESEAKIKISTATVAIRDRSQMTSAKRGGGQPKLTRGYIKERKIGKLSEKADRGGGVNFCQILADVICERSLSVLGVKELIN